MKRDIKKTPIVSGRDFEMPFSSSILATSLEAIGLNFAASQEIAEKIRAELIKKKIKVIPRKKLRNMIYEEIKESGDKRTADKYIKFRKIMALDKPLIILMGGSTGSGKNTVSVEIAHRLDITTVITSDIIREIMRSLFTEGILPLIHSSSYLAYKNLWMPIEEEKDQRIIAFREQALRVSVGIRGIIKRCINEKTSIIINGVHVLPDIISENEYKNANIIKVFLYVDGEEEHKERFYMRGKSSQQRSADRYLENFDTIRIIQDYVVREAKKQNYLCINNLDSRRTAIEIINNIIEKVSKKELIN
ncbi:MAG: ATP cone domain-containing protein [Elusimicrobiota bacterium]